MIEGLPPIRAKKIRYFQELVFKTRMHPPTLILPIEPILRDLKTIPMPPPRELNERGKGNHASTKQH